MRSGRVPMGATHRLTMDAQGFISLLAGERVYILLERPLESVSLIEMKTINVHSG